MTDGLDRMLRQLDMLVCDDLRYSRNAYLFVFGTLGQTQGARESKAHIDCRSLAFAMGHYAKDLFGPYAKDVLNSWGVENTFDMGVVVFNLGEAGMLALSKEDRLDDFKDVFHFDEFFEGEYACDGPAPDMPVVQI